MSTDTETKEIIDYPFGDYGRLAGVGDRVHIMLRPVCDSVDGEIVQADEDGLELKICDDFILPVGADEIIDIEITRRKFQA